jgi:hypothetical protein
VLVLNEVDKLSREAQHSLRRTMEKYSASCRLILCCNSSSKVTEAVRSRCLNVRVNAPTDDQVSDGYLMCHFLVPLVLTHHWLGVDSDIIYNKVLRIAWVLLLLFLVTS